MPAEFVLPAGLFWSAPPDPPPEEGYEVQFRDDPNGAHFFIYAQISSLRLERFFASALALLPPTVRAVLEVRHADVTDDDGDNDGESDEYAEASGQLTFGRGDGTFDQGRMEPETERWESEDLPLADVLRVASKYSFQLLHDGTVGFGAYDPESALEVFLDDHKLLSMFAPDPDVFTDLLARFGVPEVDAMASILDVDHEHLPLTEIPDRWPDPPREWLRRRRYDPRWFAPAIRRALDMHEQAGSSPHEGDGEDDNPGTGTDS